jgi:hypothetical protein
MCFAFSSPSFAAFFASSAARFASFLSPFVVGATAGAAAVNDVGAGALLNGLLGEVNGLDAGVNGAAARAGAAAGADGGGAASAGGANENGELGELKIDGTDGWDGAGAGGGAAGGLVNGSGYSGIVLAAAENGFVGGTYWDCCSGCQSGVACGDAGGFEDSSVFSWPGGAGTRPSATSRGSSILY